MLYIFLSVNLNDADFMHEGELEWNFRHYVALKLSNQSIYKTSVIPLMSKNKTYF